MSQDGIFNGTITHTMLGVEDHGIFTANLTIQGNHWGQGFGGVGLGSYAEQWVRGVLKALDESEWERIKGRHVRVERIGGRLLRIGHIVKDQWFDVREWQAMVAEAEKSKAPRSPGSGGPYTRDVRHVFKSGGQRWAVVAFGTEEIEFEELRKNGQEDNHMHGCASLADGRWSITEGLENILAMEGTLVVGQIESFFDEHGVPSEGS